MAGSSCSMRILTVLALALGAVSRAEPDSQCAMQLGAKKTASAAHSAAAAEAASWTLEDFNFFGGKPSNLVGEDGTAEVAAVAEASDVTSGDASASAADDFGEANAHPVGKHEFTQAKMQPAAGMAKAGNQKAHAAKGGGKGGGAKGGSKHAANQSGAVDYVEGMIDSFLQKPLPAKNEAVSQDSPLVFLHQHRAGGTTMRKLLYNTSLSMKMKPHILCSGGVDCRAFKNNVFDASVYGGEFCWRELMTSLSGKQVSCITNFREPVARIQSCYTQRIVKKKKLAPACMAKLDAAKLKSLLVNYGCVNEPFRRLGQCGVQTHADATDKKARRQIWNNTLENLASCVPVLVDKPETYSAAVKHFPQFKQAFWQMKKVKLNMNEYDAECEIPSSHMEVIKKLAAQEMMLYDAAKKRAVHLHQHSG